MISSESLISKPSLVELRYSKMVQALIELDDNTNRVLNIVKAKYDLNDKGEAIGFIVGEYIENKKDPELKPEFVKKIENIKKQKSIKVKDFAKRYGLK